MGMSALSSRSLCRNRVFILTVTATGIVTVERKIGEYWVFIPYGSRYLTVKHDKLGVLRAYAYPERIEKACVYELVLTTGRVHTVVEEAELQSGWLILQSEPSGADVYLDDKLQGTTPFQKKLLLGKYRYRLELPLYHSAAGVVELTEEGRQQLSVPLSPAFGYVHGSYGTGDGSGNYG